MGAQGAAGDFSSCGCLQPSGTEVLLLCRCAAESDGEEEEAPGGGGNSHDDSQRQAAAGKEPEDPPFVGISKQAGGRRWRAHIRVDGKDKSIGVLSSRAEAAAARDLGQRWVQLHRAGETATQEFGENC